MFSPSRFSAAMIKNFGTTFSSADGTCFLGTEKDGLLFVPVDSGVRAGDVVIRSDQVKFLVVDRPRNMQTHLEAPIREVRLHATVVRAAGGTRDAFGRTTGGTEIIYENIPVLLDGELRYTKANEPDRQGSTYVGSFLAPAEFEINQGDVLSLDSGDSFRVVSTPYQRTGLQQLSVMQIC